MKKLSSALVVALVAGFACSDPPTKGGGNNGSNNPPNGATNSASNGGTNNVVVNNGGTNNDPVTSGDRVDLLMVIDNSGSMCQEQRLLRENFDTFIASLVDAEIDFHLGVTTTQMAADYPLEPVAEPGRLQSTPQPVPGFDRSCHTAVDGNGQPIVDDFSPIRDAIGAAVECMETPDTSLTQVTNDEIRCAMYADPQGCSIDRAGCGGGAAACEPADLFPDPSTYRDIPKVLRSEDYEATGSVDIEALKMDFACMALVGTRGFGIEQGLAAAVEATSPSLTGGAVEAADADTSAPNHGLLRSDSRFALMFVTDENDCSHDGTLATDSACGGDVCEYQNSTAVDDSALVSPALLQEQLLSNLRESKGVSDLTAGDVLVASLHGASNRLMTDPPPESACGEPDYEGITPVCATSLGVAYSGDRYERFLRRFPDGNYFPAANPQMPDTALTGWMCTGDFRPALEAAGQFLAGQ